MRADDCKIYTHLSMVKKKGIKGHQLSWACQTQQKLSGFGKCHLMSMFLLRSCSLNMHQSSFSPPTQTPVSHSHKLLIDLGSAKDSHTTHDSKDQERQDLQFNLLIHRFGASVWGQSRNRLPNLMEYTTRLWAVLISLSGLHLWPSLHLKRRRPFFKGQENDMQQLSTNW